ncbi:MAG TPA: lactate racemase domain-containing protein [Gaiella sp.]|nr:lactate racemase domain-containing protein [Gaiella sp.]
MRVPLASGSRLPLVTLPDDAVLLSSPPPPDPIVDVGAAVVDALRYPLSGPPLVDLVPRGGRATVVVQPASLPFPSPVDDPRRDALGTVLTELTRAGVPGDRQTLLVAGGLSRRAGRQELEALVRRDRARSFRGRVVVHDCESDELRRIELDGRAHRVHPALLETDLVVTVGAGETVLHGGPTALLDACGPATVRATTATSLLEASGAGGWRLAAALEAELARTVPLLGLSLVLDRPRLTGPYAGFPWDEGARGALARSPVRWILNAAPAALRRRFVRRLAYDTTVVAALAGRPSVAHAEALVRGAALLGTPVERPFRTIVLPLPHVGAGLPREPLNPITAAALGLGHALRLWRDRPPLDEGGTIVLLHPFTRVIGHGPQAPYRVLLAALREEPPPRLRAVEASAARERRAVAAYRSGAAPHPRMPFADWESCQPVLARAGCVIVAGCRDAAAARALGLVPSHSAATALAMARGLAGDDGSTGVLLGPPYPRLVVGA